MLKKICFMKKKLKIDLTLAIKAWYSIQGALCEQFSRGIEIVLAVSKLAQSKTYIGTFFF